MADLQKNHITETQIGRTVYIVEAECSPKATETVEQKLERIISRHASDAVQDTESYQLNNGETLAMCGIVREHGLTTI